MDLNAVLDFAAPEDGLLGECAVVGQRVDVYAEQVLPLQHPLALCICTAPPSRQRQLLSVALPLTLLP